MRVRAAHHQMRDPVRQRVGLARTRPRDHQQRARIGPLADAMFDRRALYLSNRLYDEALTCRMRPFADGIQAFPRMVRDVARSRMFSRP